MTAGPARPRAGPQRTGTPATAIGTPGTGTRATVDRDRATGTATRATATRATPATATGPRRAGPLRARAGRTRTRSSASTRSASAPPAAGETRPTAAGWMAGRRRTNAPGRAPRSCIREQWSAGPWPTATPRDDAGRAVLGRRPARPGRAGPGPSAENRPFEDARERYVSRRDIQDVEAYDIPPVDARPLEARGRGARPIDPHPIDARWWSPVCRAADRPRPTPHRSGPTWAPEARGRSELRPDPLDVATPAAGAAASRSTRCPSTACPAYQPAPDPLAEPPAPPAGDAALTGRPRCRGVPPDPVAPELVGPQPVAPEPEPEPEPEPPSPSRNRSPSRSPTPSRRWPRCGSASTRSRCTSCRRTSTSCTGSGTR